MSNIVPTSTTMLMGVSLATPTGATRLLQSSPNVYLLSGAAELFADALDLKAPKKLADSFHSEHLNFQVLKSKGQRAKAIRAAHDELAKIIFGVSKQTWPDIAEEAVRISLRAGLNAQTPDATIHAKEMLGVGGNSWRPEIVVRANDPLKRAVGRAAIRRVMQLLLPLSIYDDECDVNWNFRTFNKGMLTAPRLEFTFSSISESGLYESPNAPEGKRIVLSAKLLDIQRGIPHLEIAYDDEKNLDDIYLAHAILTALWSYDKRRCNLRQKHFGVKDRRMRSHPQHKMLSLFKMLKDPKSRPSHINAAIPVQAAFLREDIKGEIDRALEAIGVSNKRSRMILVNNLKGLGLRFTIREISSPTTTPPRVTMELLSYDPDATTYDFRQNRMLVMKFRLPPTLTKTLSTEEVWKIVARAYAIWFVKGQSKTMKNVDFLQDSLNPNGTLDLVSFNGKNEYISLSPNIDKDWAKKFSALLNWVMKIPQGDLPGFAEINEQLRTTTSIGLDEIAGPFHINIIDERHLKGSGYIKMNLRRKKIPTAQASVHLNIDKLPGLITPIKLMELLLRARNRCRTGGYDTEKLNQKGMSFYSVGRIELHDYNWNSAWTWLRLFLDYQEILKSNKAKTGLNLMGAGIKEVAEELVRAIRVHQFQNRELFARSLREHDNWIVETSSVLGAVKRRRHEPNTVGKRRRASKMTILTLGRAKLIHFDSEPKFDDKQWERMVEIILSAPDGVTWTKPGGKWESNRPEIVLREGDKNWYAMNDVYRKAPHRRQAEYRNALSYVRDIVGQYATKIGLPKPTPQTSREDMKKLRDRMMMLFHPDMAATTDYIPDSSKTLQNLIKLFPILLKSHK